MDHRLDKIIRYFREEMMAGNAVGQSGGFSSSADAKGPVAGYDKPLKKKPQKRYAKGGTGSRKIQV